MRNVVLISSPFQLVCFFEYVKYQNLKDYDLFIYFIGERDKEQFLNLCELHSINGYSLIKIRKAFQYLHFFKLAVRYRKTNKIIIGNFFTDTFLFLVNKIVCDELIVLDDGINSFEIVKCIEHNKRITPQSKLKKIFNKVFCIDISYPLKFKLYTIFDIKPTKTFEVIKNEFTVFYSKNSNKVTDSVYIIGQPFVELNLLDKNHYSLIIQKTIKNLQNKNILYIPSRKEKKENLNFLAKTHNIKILLTDYPLEIFFLINSKPALIIGFTSTAILNPK